MSNLTPRTSPNTTTSDDWPLPWQRQLIQDGRLLNLQPFFPQYIEDGWVDFGKPSTTEVEKVLDTLMTHFLPGNVDSRKWALLATNDLAVMREIPILLPACLVIDYRLTFHPASFDHIIEAIKSPEGSPMFPREMSGFYSPDFIMFDDVRRAPKYADRYAVSLSKVFERWFSNKTRVCAIAPYDGDWSATQEASIYKDIKDLYGFIVEKTFREDATLFHHFNPEAPKVSRKGI